MISLAVLFGVFSVAVAGTPFYGPCRNVSTVKVDPSRWDTELYVNLHRYGEDYSCGYVWNSAAKTERGDILLYSTWARITNGVENMRILHASYVRDGVYEFTNTQDDGAKVKYLANFLNYEPNRLLIIYVCSDDARFANGQDQVYIETSRATAPTREACKIKRILDNNQISATELGLVDNCGCDYIPGDNRCKGYTAPSVTDLFAKC